MTTLTSSLFRRSDFRQTQKTNICRKFEHKMQIVYRTERLLLLLVNNNLLPSLLTILIQYIKSINSELEKRKKYKSTKKKTQYHYIRLYVCVFASIAKCNRKIFVRKQHKSIDA